VITTGHDANVKGSVVDGKGADDAEHQDGWHEHVAGDAEHLAAGLDGQGSDPSGLYQGGCLRE